MESDMANSHDEVTIHIDGKKYTSPNPTTGAALYTMGSVKTGFALFKEVHGHGDDLRITNDVTPVELKDGDHFYTSKDELNPGSHDRR
jgi:hypothetical protein